MLNEVVLFDIDGTLLIADAFVNMLSHPKEHLTKVHMPNVTIGLYAIHLEIMSQIFRELQRKSIQLGFITAGGYKANAIKQFFTQIYCLEQTLDDCIFIGRENFGNTNTSKGEKLAAAQQNGLLPQDRSKIRLIDDDHVHILNARDYGFATTTAAGFPTSNQIRVNHSYLQEIILTYDLDVKLPTQLCGYSPVEINSRLLRFHYAEALQNPDLNQNSEEAHCCWLPAIICKKMLLF